MHEDNEMLWRWGLHEDNLFVNQLPVTMLAESVLIAATITLLQVKQLVASRLILAGVTELIGIVVTLILYFTLALHDEQIRLLRDHLKMRDPFYRALSVKIRQARAKHRFWSALFHERGIRWVQMRLVFGGFLAFWVVSVVVTALMAFAPGIMNARV